MADTTLAKVMVVLKRIIKGKIRDMNVHVNVIRLGLKMVHDDADKYGEMDDDEACQFKYLVYLERFREKFRIAYKSK